MIAGLPRRTRCAGRKPISKSLHGWSEGNHRSSIINHKSLVAPHARLHELVVQRLDVALGRAAGALIFPGRDVRKALVVALALAIGMLVLLAKMTTAAL